MPHLKYEQKSDVKSKEIKTQHTERRARHRNTEARLGWRIKNSPTVYICSIIYLNSGLRGNLEITSMRIFFLLKFLLGTDDTEAALQHLECQDCRVLSPWTCLLILKPQLPVCFWLCGCRVHLIKAAVSINPAIMTINKGRPKINFGQQLATSTGELGNTWTILQGIFPLRIVCNFPGTGLFSQRGSLWIYRTHGEQAPSLAHASETCWKTGGC